jgi:hypothetical protein
MKSTAEGSRHGIMTFARIVRILLLENRYSQVERNGRGKEKTRKSYDEYLYSLGWAPSSIV